jgi:hypothetical protein
VSIKMEIRSVSERRRLISSRRKGWRCHHLGFVQKKRLRRCNLIALSTSHEPQIAFRHGTSRDLTPAAARKAKTGRPLPPESPFMDFRSGKKAAKMCIQPTYALKTSIFPLPRG